MAQVTIREAAERLGVSTDTVKRRLKRGELQATKRPRPQGFVWMVEMPDEPEPQQAPDDAEVQVLRAKVELLESEVQARRDEMTRLHTLLAQAQEVTRQLSATIEHEQEQAHEQPQPEPQQPPAAPRTARRRRLTWRERVLGTARL